MATVRSPYRFTLSSTTDVPEHVWFSVALRDGWTACYRLMPQDGRAVVVELRVMPTPPGGRVHIRQDGSPQGHHEPPTENGLTAAVVKDRVIVGRHVYELLPAALRGSTFGGLFRHLINPDKPPKRGRRGPKGWPDEAYARLAADYVAAYKSGSRSPVVDVAKKRGMTVIALRAALNRARRRALLTRQTGGRAGGQLTPRARTLLRPKQTKRRKDKP